MICFYLVKFEAVVLCIVVLYIYRVEVTVSYSEILNMNRATLGRKTHSGNAVQSLQSLTRSLQSLKMSLQSLNTGTIFWSQQSEHAEFCSTWSGPTTTTSTRVDFCLLQNIGT